LAAATRNQAGAALRGSRTFLNRSQGRLVGKDHNEVNHKELIGLANTTPKQGGPPSPRLPDPGSAVGLAESVPATPVGGKGSGVILELPERFVDPARAAEFLSIRPRQLLELARRNVLPGHPIGQGQRRVWRFRLSELAASVAGGVNSRPAVPGGQKARKR